MKIYTKTGDEGKTGLFGGPRVWKDDARIESYGTVDELNAHLGVVRSGDLSEAMDGPLEQVQHSLFAIGAELATPDPEEHGMDRIGLEQVRQLEELIDRFEEQLPPLSQFILPSGCLAATRMHVARGVCRRAERRLVTLSKQIDAERLQTLVCYLNRLSDLLFVMSRVANQAAGIEDVGWQQD